MVLLKALKADQERADTVQADNLGRLHSSRALVNGNSFTLPSALGIIAAICSADHFQPHPGPAVNVNGQVVCKCLLLALPALLGNGTFLDES